MSRFLPLPILMYHKLLVYLLANTDFKFYQILGEKEL